MDYSNYGRMQPRQFWPCDAKSMEQRRRMEAGEPKSFWKSILKFLREKLKLDKPSR